MSAAAPARQPAAPLAGVAMLTAAAVGYGGNIPYARLAGDLGVSGVDAVALRCACILPMFLLAAWATRTSLAVPRADRVKLFWLGLTTALTGMGYLSAIAFIPVGVAVMVFYTFPLVILLLSPLVDKVRLRPVQLAAFGLAFFGIALAIGPSFGALDWRGLALAGLASIGGASQFFIASRAPGGGGLATLTWLHAVILPIALAASLASGGPPPWTRVEAAAWPLFVTSALYIGAVILQIRGMRTTRAAVAGLVCCLEPIVATVSAALLLGERLTIAQYVGGAFVLAGIIVGLARQPAPKPA